MSQSGDDAKQEAEWQELYRGLSELLSTMGTESPFGRGDYWLVDDNWGGNLHKVCIFRIEFLSREAVARVQSLLASTAQGWGVMFQLEIKNDRGKVPPQGLIVYSDRIEEAWNRKRLARLFGKAFEWAER